MYSESDIEAAVASGALSAEAAVALRASVAAQRDAPLADEESFRLITGFNDIFVSIAAILLLVSVGWIGGSLVGTLIPPRSNAGYGPGLAEFRHGIAASSLGAALAVAVTSWLLAEYFTARRRMALPSILLLATFAGGVLATGGSIVGIVAPHPGPRGGGLAAALVGAVTAAAVYAHWRRFCVPITIAVLVVALAAVAIGLIVAIAPGATRALPGLTLAAGLCMFAYAMHWDMSDRTRTTRRSDVAFWLHLAAAPMIAHPLFALLGVTSGTATAGAAIVVLLLYLLFGIVALAVDRRAFLVSSLAYVLFALAGLFRQFGAVSLNVALTALVIGSALLMLSAFWQGARGLVVRRLPSAWQARLPVPGRVARA